ncbi:MAG: hypothetical protein WCR02_06570 [Sphaerochaetaceae bacterium]
MNRRRWVIIPLLFLCCLLSAEGTDKQYLIESYQFTITGKTSESALRSSLIPEGNEFFPSEEAMVANLEAKKQTLVNKRIFSSVEYTYTLTNESKGTRFYKVHFIISDSETLFQLPYGKYDSNYGLRAGLKLYNNNLFGQLADMYWVVHTTQNDNSFKKGTYYSALDLNNILIGKKAKFGLHAKFNYDISTVTNTYFYFNVSTQNLILDHKPIDFNPWFYLNPLDGSNTGRWGFTEIGNISNFGPFAMVLGGFSIYNKTKITPVDETVSTLTYFRFHGLKIAKKNFDFRFSVESNGTTDGVLSSIRIGETIGVNFTLFNCLNWYNEVSQYNKMYPNSPLLYEFSLQWGSTLSQSSINWVGNFRKGLSLKIHSEIEWFPKPTYQGRPYEDSTWYYIEAMVTWFPFATSWFNPSFRLTGTQSNVAQYFLPDNTDELFADYMRGIRLDNQYVYSSTKKEKKTAFAFNCNLTSSFITLRNFAHTYANPFIDLGLVNDSLEDGKYVFLSSVGLEGIVILDKYPSFPLRASLGINLDDLIKKFKGTLSGSMEYELFLGMYFFF